MKICHDPNDEEEGPHYLPTMFMCPSNCQMQSGFISNAEVINNGTQLNMTRGGVTDEFCLAYSCNEDDIMFWDIHYIACLCSDKTLRY